jgi:hypothetical protein
MCTLVVAHRCLRNTPLAVAANRDEMLARPASGPRILPGAPRRLAPRDEVGGGTWLGLNEHGLFVGVTNRAGHLPDPTKRSRGLLVLDALQQRDARSLSAALASLKPDEYNPFHLLYADADAAFVTWSDMARVSHQSLEPGVHVVTERSLGADDRGRTEMLLGLFRARFGAGQADIATLDELLVQHGPPGEPLAGSCVHADALGYGTRSSFLYIAGAQPRAAWREGHACRNPLVDIGDLLRELFGRGR